MRCNSRQPLCSVYMFLCMPGTKVHAAVLTMMQLAAAMLLMQSDAGMYQASTQVSGNAPHDGPAGQGDPAHKTLLATGHS